MRTALVIGSAPCWEKDLDLFEAFCVDYEVFAVGMDCPYMGRIQYMATYHPKDVPLFFRKRNKENMNTDYVVISHVVAEGVDLVYPFEKPSGSSSLLAAMSAVDLGYFKIVLIGCPLEGVNDKNYPYTVFRKGWQAHVNKLEKRVRSMSGWTAEFLGEPTLEWVRNENGIN